MQIMGEGPDDDEGEDLDDATDDEDVDGDSYGEDEEEDAYEDDDEEGEAKDGHDEEADDAEMNEEGKGLVVFKFPFHIHKFFRGPR